MLKNDFAAKAMGAETKGWNSDQLKELLGKKREMLGIYEGNEEEGKFEAGQSSGLIKEILSVELVMKKLLKEIDGANSRNQKVIVN